NAPLTITSLWRPMTIYRQGTRRKAGRNCWTILFRFEEQHTMNDIEAVRPRRLAISDKYSVNLYRYIRKWREWGVGAFASDRNWITGEVDGFDFADPKPFRIIIGRKDD